MTNSKKNNSDVALVRRTRGRPARLSRAAVIDKATQLLAEIGNLEELTMTRIAQELGAVPMALYTYFPNRDALLAALSAETFAGFVYEVRTDEPWQVRLRGWLQALQAYLQRFPHLRRSIGWNSDGAVSSTWTKMVLPVLDVLIEQGLTEQRLALAFNWFVESAMGFLILVGRSSSYRQQMSMSSLDHLSKTDQQTLLKLLPYLDTSASDELTELGFSSLINELERFLRAEQIEQIGRVGASDTANKPSKVNKVDKANKVTAGKKIKSSKKSAVDHNNPPA